MSVKDAAEIIEDKGYKKIKIPTGSNKSTGEKYSFTMSVFQARAVVTYFHDIQEFIEQDREEYLQRKERGR